MDRSVMAQRILDNFAAMHELDVRIAAFKRNVKIERDQLKADIAALQEELDSRQMRLDDQEGL